MSYVQQHCEHCGTTTAGAKFCPECGLPLGEPTTTPTKVNEVETPKQRRSPGLWTIAIVGLVLALVGVGFGVAGFLQARTAHEQLGALRHQLTSDTHQEHATQQQISTLKANSTTGAVTKLKAEMGAYQTCIPEIQQELNGLNVSTQNTNGYLTNAYLQNPTIISQDCKGALGQ